ncbi:MAG: lipocalin-like domain-containing protein [Polyangiaceae bacterium]
MPNPPWDVWPYHRPGSAVTFPRDEGWHRLLPGRIANPALSDMEWVYFNSHVKEQGGAGRRFIVFAAYFTQAIRFLVVRAWDAQDKYLGAWTGTAWGLLRPSAERLDFTFKHGGGTDTWKTKEVGGAPVPFSSELHAVDDAGKFSVDLELTNKKRPYEAGGRGYLPFGRRGSFYYYSLTRLAVSGTLKLTKLDGSGMETVSIAGDGWYDHQWGPFYVTPLRNKNLEQYEWMSIQLDSGDEILLTTVWEANGETPSLPAYGGAGLIRADQTFDKLVGSQRWQRKRFWRSGKQHAVYASEWTFDAPEWGTSLVIKPRYHDQLTPLIDEPPPNILGTVSRLFEGWASWLGDFWEGSCSVSGTFNGQPATGVAFAELVKRYEDPQFRVELVRSEPNLTVLEWRVQNPDEQVPLKYRFFLEKEDGSPIVDEDNLEVPVMVLDDPNLPKNTPLIARVVASSIDGTLSGVSVLTLQLR